MSRLVDLVGDLFAFFGMFVVLDVLAERAIWWLRDLLELRRSIIEEQDAQARAAVRRRDSYRSQVR